MIKTRSHEILQLTAQIPLSVAEVASDMRVFRGSVPTDKEVADRWAAVTWAAAEALYDKYTAEEQKELDAYEEPEK